MRFKTTRNKGTGRLAVFCILLKVAPSRLKIQCIYQKQGLIQDLNLGGDKIFLSHWSITNVKKYCRQTGLLCSALHSI